MAPPCDRRTFLQSAALAGALQIVPRRVLGRGQVPPSDKITVAYIGLGTQGLRELPRMLENPDVQVVAVCDPNRESTDYRDWSRDGIRSSLAKLLELPSWREGTSGVPGGREVGRDVVETYYGRTRPSGNYKGCASYADVRELLEKAPDVDAVKIMTPDHLHGYIAIAAMKRGKHVLVHKPLANRMSEVKAALETARQTGVTTHLIPWDSNGSMEFVSAWIDGGAIGRLREIHCWTNRPVWPQYTALPADTPPVPPGFDWDLWLGPERQRPYHPSYTHMVFRGWYDFGGGAIADMGHYSLLSVFKALELGPPLSAEPIMSHVCTLDGPVAQRVRNDFSFPTASIVRFRFAARGTRPPLDLVWYEGGMRPPTPDEMAEDGREMTPEGLMFVGDGGKIVSGFRLDGAQLVPGKRWAQFQGPKPPAAAPAGSGGARGRSGSDPSRGLAEFVAAVRERRQSSASFLVSGAFSETANLAAVALRAGRKVIYDSAAMKITNVPEANVHLTREYRQGWELG